MPISFPSNPSSGDTYDFGGIHYIYNGDGWVNKSIYGISAGSNISFANYNGTGPIVISASVSGGGITSAVTSFNGKTGSVQGVSSFAGLTGTVGSGITTNGILYFDGTDVQGSALLTFDGSDIFLDTSGHFDGNMLGRSEAYIKADESITEGDPVYVTGSVGASERLTVAKADASVSAKMPAAGIAAQSLATNGEGEMVISGWIRDYDTTGLTANQTLYVAAGGGLTATRPTAAGVLVQNIARVGRPNNSNGSIIVTGASRTNDVPNALKVYQYIEMPGGFTFDTVVSSFNGKTGAVQGVSSINGNTGAITNVAFTNTAQSFSGLQQFTQGISGSGGVTFYFPSGNTSIRFVSTAARYIEITPGLQNSMVGYGSGGFKFKANSGPLSLAATNVTAIGDVDLENQETILYVNADSGIITFSFVGGEYTFPNTDGSANDVLTTDGAGQISWVGNVAKTNIAQSFTGLQEFPGGISASGATFSSNVNINAKTILGSTVLGSATPGCIEFDGNVLYVGTTGGRGIIEAPHISYATSLVSLSGVTTYQNIFSTPADVITLAANTSYIVEGNIIVQSGTTTHTTAIRLNDGVAATPPIFRLHILNTAAAAGTVTRAQDSVYFETSGGVINATSASARNYILLRGSIETGSSVTITPQVAFSANPGGTNQIQDGSWIKFTPVGTSTMTFVGPWA